MKHLIYWLVFGLAVYVIACYILPKAIDREFANQESLIERHIEITNPSNNPYK